ncbi:unnamed protein product [Lactuca saligna]|uniref:Uncharacterized protein n=1 Tax=Lactuca saligna TaxID=75948 RepID=A0AA35Z3V5_LACSI|nr:unnamed protein product [Lactuca saligna]
MPTAPLSQSANPLLLLPTRVFIGLLSTMVTASTAYFLYWRGKLRNHQGSRCPVVSKTGSVTADVKAFGYRLFQQFPTTKKLVVLYYHNILINSTHLREQIIRRLFLGFIGEPLIFHQRHTQVVIVVCGFPATTIANLRFEASILFKMTSIPDKIPKVETNSDLQHVIEIARQVFRCRRKKTDYDDVFINCCLSNLLQTRKLRNLIHKNVSRKQADGSPTIDREGMADIGERNSEREGYSAYSVPGATSWSFIHNGIHRTTLRRYLLTICNIQIPSNKEIIHLRRMLGNTSTESEIYETSEREIMVGTRHTPELTAEEVRAAPDVVAGTSDDRGKAPA